MKKFCTLVPYVKSKFKDKHVKNSEGKKIVSPLWEKLISNFDRDTAKLYFKIAYSKEFIDKIKETHFLITNPEVPNEIDFDFFAEITGIKNSEELQNKINDLNSTYSKSGITLDEALNDSVEFNKDDRYNTFFLCRIVKNKDNDELYDIDIVKKTKDNEKQLRDFINNQTAVNSCLSILSSLGYNISKDDSRFLFTNPDAPTKILETFESVIIPDNVEETNENILKTFAQMVFNLEKTIGSTLINRAIKNLNDNSEKLGISSPSDYFIDLVVKAMKNKEKNDNTSIIGRAVNFVLERIYNFYNRLKGIDVRTARSNAKYIAQKYLRDSKLINVDQNDNDESNSNEQTLSSIVDNTIKSLNILSTKFQNTGDKIAQKRLQESFFDNIIDNYSRYAKGFNSIDTRLLSQILQQFETYCIGFQNDFLKIKELRSSDDSVMAQISICKKIYEARLVTNCMNEIHESLSVFLQSLPREHYTKTTQDLVELNSKMNDYLKGYKDKKDQYVEGLLDVIHKEELVSFTTFLKNIYGSDFIKAKAGICFGRKPNGKIGFYKIKNDDGLNYDIEKILNGDYEGETNEEISMFRAWLATAFDNTDIMSKSIDFANKECEDGITNEMEHELGKINSILNELYAIDGFDIHKQYLLFEKDRHGINTGNYISKYNQYLFEKDTKEFLAEEFRKWGRDFESKHKGTLDKYPTREKMNSWNAWKKEALKDYYTKKDEFGNTKGKEIKVHSEKYDRDYTIWIAGEQYLNKDYEKLIERFKGIDKVLDKIIDFKRKQDEKLNGFGASSKYLAPQIDSYTTNMMANAVDDKSWAYIGSLMRRKLHNICNINQNSIEWGAEVNRVDQLGYSDLFDKQIIKDKKKDEAIDINTLTIYGVKKLYDPKLMTTDIAHGLIAYTNMATSYKHKNILMSNLNVGLELIDKRKIYKRTKSEFETVNTASSWNNRRIRAQIRNNVLGKKFNVTPSPLLVIIRKMAAIGTFFALGGNDITAFVNLGTGLTDVMREGLASGKYKLSDLIKTTLMYSAGTLEKGVKTIGGKKLNDTNFGNEITDSFIETFERRFNIQNKNRVVYDNIKAGRTQFAKVVGSIPDAFFAMYQFGDNIMRVLPTMSVFYNKKVINIDGSTLNLLSLYKQNKNGSILYASSNIDDSEVLNKLYNNFVDYLRSEESGKIILSPQEKEVLIKYGLSEKVNSEKDLLKIKRQIEKLDCFFLSDTDNDAKENMEKFNSINKLIDEIYDNDNLNEIIKNNTDFIKSLGVENYVFLPKAEFLNELERIKNDLTYTLKTENKVLAETKSMLTDFHGVYDNIDATWLQSTFVGALILGMRGYMPGYLQRSFAGYNKWTGKEGFVTSFAKALLFYMTFQGGGKNVAEKAKNFFKPISFIISPFIANDLVDSLVEDGFSEYQAQNVVRFVTEVSIITAELVMRTMIKSAIASLGDEEKKINLTQEELDDIEIRKNRLYRRLYMIERLLFERMAYIEPGTMKKEFSSVTNIMPSGLNVFFRTAGLVREGLLVWWFNNEIDNVTLNGTLDPIKDRSAIKANLDELFLQHPSLKGLIYEKNSKVNGYSIGESKFLKDIQKKTPFIRDIYWYNNAEERYRSWIFFNRLVN
jgi:hypothetical protein